MDNTKTGKILLCMYCKVVSLNGTKEAVINYTIPEAIWYANETQSSGETVPKFVYSLVSSFVQQPVSCLAFKEAFNVYYSLYSVMN